ncbi:glutamate--cysteine ligase [Nocardia rhizosphaerihabitans]|uniref:Putative glutamate--cysteine ligase 2 n=1 Tax=Nocardia rhizosphaerihabitans TaxID=1691570 RepID=A0ABQ2KA59_9NOCA|nr:glutamate--cysteine ligase [Nocardia rhizosphaerihabitans]GGN77433.1 putative glutamate--cysteine ligase 2-3 [Nocardia rhizosphaerihabitans]
MATLSIDQRDRLHNDVRAYTVGVEEEFVLIDPATGRPSLTNTTVAAAETDIELQLELSRCQIETCTPVCASIEAVHREVRRARVALIDAAARSGSLPLAVGVPIWGPPTGSITDTPRYQRMAEHFGALAEQVICGCHVHVCVPERDLAVQVSNHLSHWLPPLLALTANSPIAEGIDTGHASWRHVVWARWPSAGPPPYFRSAAHYDDIVAGLAEDGHILDPAMVYWDVRLSAHLPTIEIRISDVPATVLETALLASLVRALVITSVAAIGRGHLAVPIASTRLRSACSCAARDGLASTRFPPALTQLLCHVRSALEESGDYEFTRDALATVLTSGNGAVRQRGALLAGGPANVVDVLSRLTVEGCEADDSQRAI